MDRAPKVILEPLFLSVGGIRHGTVHSHTGIHGIVRKAGDLDHIQWERCGPHMPRAFGAARLGLQVVERLRLPLFLSQHLPAGRGEAPGAMMALVLLRARFRQSSSALAPVVGGCAATAVPELPGIPAGKPGDDLFYRTLDRLLPLKTPSERHLKARLGELFQLAYDLLPYDVTSSHFEELAAGNPQARHGHSRDHRG